MNKKQIYLKYLLTFANLLLMVDITMIYIFDKNNQSQTLPIWLTVVSILFWLLSIMLISLYWWIRLKEMKTTEFEFSQRDKMFAMISLVTYYANIFLALVCIILAHIIDSSFVMFLSLIILILIISVTASVLELYSRINYQVYLNQKAFLEYEVNQQEKVKKVMSELNVDKNKATIIANNKNRTEQAKEILKKDIDKMNETNPFDEE